MIRNKVKSTLYYVFLMCILNEGTILSQNQPEAGYISENQKKIDILHYDLEFDLHPEEKYFDASAKISGRVNDSSLRVIDLNFYDNFNIEEVQLNKKQAKFENENKALSIPFTHRIDTFTVFIKYSGTPLRAGLEGFVFGKRDGYSLVYTLSEPNYASTWFPCNDKPDDKALLDIKITNDSNFTSVSNGKLISTKTRGNKKTFHWKTIYPISTYLISLYSADYEFFFDEYISVDKKDTMKIQYYVLPDKLENAKVDFSEHTQMMSYFSSTFGEYPFIKEKYGIAEFLWMMGAMENQTITGISSSLIGGKKIYNDFFVHELAHHWWGDAISPKDWKDIWLNEGFSTYSEALYFEFQGGSESLQSTMRSKYSDNFRGTIGNPESSLFNNTIYNKGAWVLHMLRWEVGDSAFFQILRNYFDEYKYSNASTDDFIKIAEEMSGKDLQIFFDQFLDVEGEIKVNYYWRCEKFESKYKTVLSVMQIQEEIETYKFTLQVLLKAYNGEVFYEKIFVSSRETKFQFITGSEIEFVILDPDSWLLGTFIEENESNK